MLCRDPTRRRRSFKPEVEAAIQTVKQQLTQPGPQLSLQGALEAKRILDQAVSEVRGYEGADLAASCLANIRRDAASSLRYELNKASPDLAALNVKYKF